MEGQEQASCELTEIVQATDGFKHGIESGTLTCMDTGDGMVLAFEGDPTAPAYASLQIAIARGSSPERPIRMGLHSGPVVRVRDINGRFNFKGVGMNVAQRVMDCAHGGQITMTEHYASLLRSYDGWGERIVSRGEFTVKHGLKLRVCELLHPYSPKQHFQGALRQNLTPVSKTAKMFGLSTVVAVSGLNLYFLATWPFTSRINIPAPTGIVTPGDRIRYRDSTIEIPAEVKARIEREDAAAGRPALGLPAMPSDTDPGRLNPATIRSAPNALQKDYGLSWTIDPNSGKPIFPPH